MLPLVKECILSCWWAAVLNFMREVPEFRQQREFEMVDSSWWEELESRELLIYI